LEAGVSEFAVGVVNFKDGLESVLADLSFGKGKGVADEVLGGVDVSFPVDGASDDAPKVLGAVAAHVGVVFAERDLEEFLLVLGGIVVRKEEELDIGLEAGVVDDNREGGIESLDVLGYLFPAVVPIETTVVLIENNDGAIELDERERNEGSEADDGKSLEQFGAEEFESFDEAERNNNGLGDDELEAANSGVGIAGDGGGEGGNEEEAQGEKSELAEVLGAEEAVHSVEIEGSLPDEESGEIRKGASGAIIAENKHVAGGEVGNIEG